MCTTNVFVDTAKCMYMFTMVSNMHAFLDIPVIHGLPPQMFMCISMPKRCNGKRLWTWALPTNLPGLCVPELTRGKLTGLKILAFKYA